MEKIEADTPKRELSPSGAKNLPTKAIIYITYPSLTVNKYQRAVNGLGSVSDKRLGGQLVMSGSY
jgi:hypothetical protein